MKPPDGLKLALAQPQIREAEAADGREADATGMIRNAGSSGADLILFPESFPGPIEGGGYRDSEREIVLACKEAGADARWGRIERGEDGRFRTVALLTSGSGERIGRYVRSHPATGDVHQVLSGVPMAPGEELGLFELDGLRLGITICSELWNPEISRVLALRGAELLLAPAGGSFHRVAANWQLMARARAIENELYVGLTQQLFGDESGSAMVAGPEAVLATLTDPGLLVVDLDLERSRWLRGRDDSMQEPKEFDALPGLLRARRPELYSDLGLPVPGLYDYDAAGG